MKRAIQKVQMLKNMTKIFAEGNYQVTVKNILNALQNQNESDMQYLEKQMLKIFPICHKIKHYLKQVDKFHLFIKQLQIEIHQQKDIIFSMGEVGRKMYFVLDGNLNVYPYEEHEITVLVPGDYFGEVSLHHRLPRTATVVCQNDSVLLAISYETYYNFMQPVIEHQIAIQYYQLKPAAIFYGWNELALALVQHHLKIITKQRNQFVYTEGQIDKSFYVVKSGEIVIQRQTLVKGKKNTHQLVVLGAGQCFGDFEYLDNSSWFQNRAQLDLIKRTTSAVSTTTTDLYQVPLLQYLQIAENYQSVLLAKYIKRNKSLIQERIKELQKRLETLNNSDEFESQKNSYVIEVKPLPSNPYQNLLQTIRNKKIILRTTDVSQDQKNETEKQPESNIQDLKKKFQNYFYQPNHVTLQQSNFRNISKTQQQSHRVQKTQNQQLSDRKIQTNLTKITTMRDKLIAQYSQDCDFRERNLTSRQRFSQFNSSPLLFYQDHQSLNIKSYNRSRNVTPSKSMAGKTVIQEFNQKKNEIHNIHLIKPSSQNSLFQESEGDYLVKKVPIEVRKSKRQSYACLITQL